ncbi:hypothetical protein CAEBREN_13463 [Caenorhabditis brenneri]|uniref:Uncharacterized protein n=1 Tax=Caenorhabditis brenneri TaxID=135651 RepID=G0P1L3_CAEBE|nr:hypothetical protein CAEBREN_13463 [Caenorhabditis brenneri]
MAYFAKATVPKDLEKEIHVTRPPTDLPNYANSNVLFSANAPMNNSYQDFKQDPVGIVTAKQTASAGGNERKCKMSRTVERAKVGLPTPSRTAYQLMYDCLQTFEGFKNDNKFIKEFMQTLLKTEEKIRPKPKVENFHGQHSVRCDV